MATKRLPDEGTLRRLYIDEGKSLQEIGEIYRVTRSAVQGALESMGIDRRNKSEARLLALKRGKLPAHRPHNFNRGFFSEWSGPMAYILGLVYSEAYVGTRQINFAFGAKDRQVLENIRALMSSDRELTEFDNHGYPSWRLVFSSVEMIADLERIGIHPGANSLRITFPNIPSGYAQHFVRGYFDGDGSINGDIVRFHSASGIFLEGMQDCILGKLDITGKMHESPPKLNRYPQGTVGWTHSAYVLLYGARAHREAIYHWFYDDVPEGQYLGRKKLRFEESVGKPHHNNHKWADRQSNVGSKQNIPYRRRQDE